MLSWFAVNSRRGMICLRVIIRETSHPNLDRQPSDKQVPGRSVQRRTCGNVLQGYRDGTGAVGTGTFCPEPEQSRSRRYILLGAGRGAVYHNKLCGWLRSLRLCGQPGDDEGKKSCNEVWRHNWAIGCGSCDRNEPDAELHGKTVAASSKRRRYSFYESYGVQSDVGIRFMKVTVLFYGVPLVQ